MSATATAQPATRTWLGALAGRPWLIPVALSVGWMIVYLVTGPAANGEMFLPLADAFVHGRLHLLEDRDWLELVPRPEGGQYVPLPPAPALTLIPVVLVMGSQPLETELPSNVYAALVGGLNVALVYLLLEGWGVARRPRVWLTIGFTGTTHWWVAGMAGPHHYAEVCAVFFCLAGLNLAVRRRAPIAAGLLLGLAAASRVPVGLALPVFVALYARGEPASGETALSGRARLAARLADWRPRPAHAALLAGVAVPAVLVAAYNVARFGSPLDFGYAHIPSGDGLITDEPWFREGLMSLSYIPRHLEVMFLETFRLVPEPPFLRPMWTGAALWLTAPFLFWALKARGPMVAILWLGVLAVLIPDLMWGSWGFAQFGYRRILDVVPLLMLLLGTAFRGSIGAVPIATIVSGIVVHAYGIFVITVLDFVG